MKNGKHLFQHAAFPPPSEVILNQRSKSQLMPVCFGYSKPNRRLCSMRAEALHGTRGWKSAVSPGEPARRLKALEKLRWTMSVSLPLPRVKAMQSWITRWPRALCAVCVEKASSICFFYIFTITITLSFCCNTCHAPYKQLPVPTTTLIFTLKIISQFLKQLKTLWLTLNPAGIANIPASVELAIICN